jgi:hypothetical protein
VTRILSAIEQGDPQAAERLWTYARSFLAKKMGPSG